MPRSSIAYLIGLIRVFLRHRLHHLFATEHLPNTSSRWILAVLKRLLPARGNLPDQLATALASRGPVFIKLGQLLSTRPDIFSPEICRGLAKLQDRVDPLPNNVSLELIHQALGAEALANFSHIDPEPIASASIAQVHGARLETGEAVVIKVVRPNIEARIQAEMQALIEVAAWLETQVPFLRQLHATQILDDQRTVLLTELSMFQEARNQIQLRRNFADSSLLWVPRLYPKFTRMNLLVMQRVDAPSIGELERLKSVGVDFEVLAHKGVETFFTQVFEHNFFHADMHPGNVFVDISSPQDPKWIALDCAIIGRLNRSDQTYIAQNLIAFFARDYRQIVNLHLRSGWIPADTDADAFEQVIREVCEPIFGKPLGEISFAAFMTQLLDTARDFGMQVQPQLVLLQKTLLYVEGLGRQLYPELDLWETAEPFMHRWAIEHLGPLAVFNTLVEQGPRIWAELYRLPELLDDTQTIGLRKQVASQQKSIESMQEQIMAGQRRSRRTRYLLTVAAASGFAIWWVS